MRYLILGNGWIGNRLKEYLGDQATIFNEDIRKFTPILSGALEYDVWINTAAKTNIDWCEKNKIEAYHINTTAACDLAKLARAYNKKYVFFSSACIFESRDINDIKYEDSEPNPQCYYAKTKQLAEEKILEVNPDALIIRPRLPISEFPHPRNTLNKLLGYNRLNDNQESVTIIEDMLPVLKELIEKNEKGIFHLVNEGTVSPAGLGNYLGHSFETVTKEEQDYRMAKEGRAKRVTTYVGSKKIPLLPDVRERIINIASNFKSRYVG